MPNQHTNPSNLTGSVVGKWIIGESYSENGITYYHCVCKCGNKQVIARNNLTSKRTKQCTDCRALGNIRTICSRGHDTGVCGRNKSGGCKACSRENHFISSYGITFEEYESLYKLQKGKCAICGKSLELVKSTDPDLKKGRAEVDHKHVLKKIKPQPSKKSTVRGLLCGGRWAGCNHKLGKVDNVEWLLAAAAYVSNPPAHRLFKESER